MEEMDGIQLALNHFEVRASFFKDIIKNNCTDLKYCMSQDSVLYNDFFLNPDETYEKLNSPKSKTRQWLIERSIPCLNQ